MIINLRPINFPEANVRALGFELPQWLHHLAVTKQVEAMPAFIDDHQRITMWKCDSLFARIKFLLNGKINLVQLGTKPVPTAMSIGNPFRTDGEM